jgi:hypothetical protein
MWAFVLVGCLAVLAVGVQIVNTQLSEGTGGVVERPESSSSNRSEEKK